MSQSSDVGDALGNVGQNYDDALQQMGNAAITVGNANPTRAETLEILREVYDAAPGLQEIPGRRLR